MNLPWLPVFNTTVLIAHTQFMWQVAVNPFRSLSYSICLSVWALNFIPGRRGLCLSSPLVVPCPPAATSPVCDGEVVSSKVAKGDSQNTAFPSIHVQLVWLSGDLSAATIGLGVKLCATMAPFSEQTIQAGKTIRYDTNERDEYTKPRTPTCIIYTHTRLITGILSAIFFSLPAVKTAHFLHCDK